MTQLATGTTPNGGVVAEEVVDQQLETKPADDVLFEGDVDDNMMIFDSETIPDEARRERIEKGLPKLPDKPPEPTAFLDCDPIDTLLGLSIPQIKKSLLEMLPDDDYLDELSRKENERPKPRSGVFDVITECQKIASGVDYLEAQTARNKLLSITPEYCAICAFSYAIGKGEVECITAYDRESEIALLEKFWSLVSLDFKLVGFNILAFDLPVIFARSIILGVSQRRSISTAPFRNSDVLDLYVERFGSSGKGAKGTGTLKSLAAAYGIRIPADGIDGSQVYELYQKEKPNFKKLIEYAKSDV